MKLKKLVYGLFALQLLTAGFLAVSSLPAQAEDGFVFEPDPSIVDMRNTKKTSEISIRDPYVLVYGNLYFMYGTGAATTAGYGCYISEDLENWAGPVNVFEADETFDGIKQFWAPEVHHYNGQFYLFGSYYAQSTGHRGTSVFRSASPIGPFEEISDGHITPKDWDSIDGTLFVDDAGQPWMVFVHEWTSMPDGIGDMSAAKLSDDFSHFISEPVSLFKAKPVVWATGNITDGPFVYQTKSGKLLLLWSNNSINGYSVGIAESKNGKIDGEWKQQPAMLYPFSNYFKHDGGHAMLFETLDGKLMMAFHSPNSSTEKMTTAEFHEVVDKGGTLVIKSVAEQSKSFANRMKDLFFMLKVYFNYLRIFLGL
ncbi:MAG: glycoside hydrolase family 43 protein [Oscillospiraceae bacterium]|jgi:beta-xylosidase|nr:glycoside hydrolase family 43 protein [Oscillospiraceae bacterium]